jgi:hypothetical protein
MRNSLHRRTRRAKPLFQQEKIGVYFDENAKNKTLVNPVNKENKEL